LHRPANQGGIVDSVGRVATFWLQPGIGSRRCAPNIRATSSHYEPVPKDQTSESECLVEQFEHLRWIKDGAGIEQCCGVAERVQRVGLQRFLGDTDFAQGHWVFDS